MPHNILANRRLGKLVISGILGLTMASIKSASRRYSIRANEGFFAIQLVGTIRYLKGINKR